MFVSTGILHQCRYVRPPLVGERVRPHIREGCGRCDVGHLSDELRKCGELGKILDACLEAHLEHQSRYYRTEVGVASHLSDSVYLQTAVANFSEYNKRLEKALSGELTDADLMKIHELTYTLENALEKINDDLEDLADTLEEVHIASETFKRDELKKVAPQYLETSRQIIK